MKIRSLSDAKSAAVLATFSIVSVVALLTQITSLLAFNIGLDRYALLCVLPALTHPSSSTNSA